MINKFFVLNSIVLIVLIVIVYKAIHWPLVIKYVDNLVARIYNKLFPRYLVNTSNVSYVVEFITAKEGKLRFERVEPCLWKAFTYDKKTKAWVFQYKIWSESDEPYYLWYKYMCELPNILD